MAAEQPQAAKEPSFMVTVMPISFADVHLRRMEITGIIEVLEDHFS